MKRKVCFFAKVKDREVLERVEFYAQDISILRDLGFDVHIATGLSEIKPADLYFIWWWTWAFFPVLFATQLRRPSLVTGVFDGWAFDQRPTLHKKMMKFALKRADVNVFVSQLEYQQIPQMLPVNNPRYSSPIVNTDIYQPGNRGQEQIIFTVAWLEGANAERKCIPEIIKAISKVRDEYPTARFIIAGEHGSYYPKLAELAKEMGVVEQVDFPGIITKQKKIELMQQCSVYLQPSRFEGFGLAILEAMSCGAAVVTSPVGAVPEVVGDVAVLVDGTSPEAIATAVNNLLENSDVRQEMGRRARARAETLFSYGRRKQDLRGVIDDICQ